GPSPTGVVFKHATKACGAASTDGVATDRHAGALVARRGVGDRLPTREDRTAAGADHGGDDARPAGAARTRQPPRRGPTVHLSIACVAGRRPGGGDARAVAQSVRRRRHGLRHSVARLAQADAGGSRRSAASGTQEGAPLMEHILTTWLLTYGVHSAMYTALAFVAERTRWGAVASRRDAFWKLALVGGVVTSTVFVVAGWGRSGAAGSPRAQG